MNKRAKGNEKEKVAMEYLISRGFLPLGKNYTVKGGEIDLIMQDGEFIVFIEVKSLEDNNTFSIYESLSKTKKKRLKFAINRWLYRNNKLDAIWRVDFIGLTRDKLEHFKFIEL